jgi:NADH-quinone oxidoreductase subunit L
MRNMGGMRAFMPITWVTMWIATLAISGIWPFAGFFSKDEIIWYTAAFGGSANAPFPGLYTIYWILALATALLTAFYMTRMMVLTFHGQNRTGQEEAKHIHEVSAIMWGPLAVLALLSMFGGWINVPEAIRTSFLGGFGALPMSEWLHHWLEPVTERALHVQEINLGELSHAAPFGGGELAWAVISTVLAGIVVLASIRYIGARPGVPAHDDKEPTGFAKVLYNKWYVDEFYDRFIVQPIIRFSRFCWKVIDATIIDGIVNAVGWVARGFGWGISMFQNGSVNTYALILTVGVLVILGVSIL